MVFVILLVIFPFCLFALMLVMDRVEQPLRADAPANQVAAALPGPRVEDVEHLGSERVSPPAEGYRRHRARTGAVAARAELLKRPVKAVLARR